MIEALPVAVHDDIVEELEHLLAMARSGELVGLTVTGELTGHRLFTWTDTRDGVTLLGHLARQMHGAQKVLDAAPDRD